MVLFSWIEDRNDSDLMGGGADGSTGEGGRENILWKGLKSHFSKEQTLKILEKI